MRDEELDTLVRSWIAHNQSDAPELFWAWNRVTDLVLQEPDVAWAVVLALVKAAPDDEVLANVAAGPLEDLLSNHGAMVIDRLEVEARRDPRFRKCLGGSWGWRRMPRDVWERVMKAAGTGGP